MPVDIYLYEDIEQGLASRIVGELRTADGADILLHVNSYGGDVFEGKTIMQALRAHEGMVTARVEGIAASAASFITVGGADRIVMCEGSRLMIHNALSMAYGNANDLDKLSEQLRGQSQDIAAIYAERSGTPVEAWLEAMDKETYFTAEQAVEAGLADEVEAKRSAAAAVNVPRSRVANMIAATGAEPSPELLTNRAAAPPPRPVHRSGIGDEETITTPSDGQKGDAMSILNQLAQELGKKPEDVQAALSGFFNESLEVTTPIVVNYPDEVTVVPTGKVEVAPDVELPEGVEVVAEAPDNFVAEVVEGGKVVIRATDAVSVDDTAEVTITVGENSVIVKVTVVAADSEDKEEDATTTGDDVPAADGEAGDTVAEFGEVPRGYALVPQAHLDDLTARAQAGDAAYSMKAEADLEAEVDGYIADGRFSVGLRNRVLADMKANAELARRTWGHLPKGSIPRSELGYGADHVNPDGANAVDLIAKANANKNKTN